MPDTHAEPTVSENVLSPDALRRLAATAARRNWGLSLVLIGWLHLAAFGLCWYLTQRDIHDGSAYLSIWLAELAVMALIFRAVGGPARPEDADAGTVFVTRVWTAYFLLAFNLASLNTLRGHAMFELFPATASLGSFAFLVLTVTVDRRFFFAVLALFGSGLCMAAWHAHAYAVFAVAWWAVLQGIGWVLAARRSADRDLGRRRLEGNALDGQAEGSGNAGTVGPRGHDDFRLDRGEKAAVASAVAVDGDVERLADGQVA